MRLQGVPLDLLHQDVDQVQVPLGLQMGEVWDGAELQEDAKIEEYHRKAA